MPNKLAGVAFGLREQILDSSFASATDSSLTWPIAESRSDFFREVFPEDFLRLGLPAEGMIVSLVDVVLHLGRQRWSDFTAAGFTAQMRSVGIELSFEVNEHRTTRGEISHRRHQMPPHS